MPLLRAIAAALIASFLLVPAVTRVGQPLHAAKRSAPAPSFTKSVDVPPDPVIVLPDVSWQPTDVEPLLQPVGRFIPAVVEALPRAPIIFDVRSLRAPPVRLAA